MNTLLISLVLLASPLTKTTTVGPLSVAAADNKALAADAKKRGDTALDAGRVAEALALYEEASRLAPDDSALLYNRARTHEKLGQFPEALALLEKFDSDASMELRAKVPKLKSLIAEIKQKTSRLILTCNIDGAEVRFKNRVLGTTPLSVTVLTSETGQLSVNKEGYFGWTKDVVLAGGADASFDIPLASRSNQGLLKVTSPIEASKVFINGTAVGQVPFETTLSAGTYQIKLEKDGFNALETSVVLGVGETKAVTLSLEPAQSIVSRWYFWAGVAVAIGVGVGVGIAATTEKEPVAGTLGIERAGLFKF